MKHWIDLDAITEEEVLRWAASGQAPQPPRYRVELLGAETYTGYATDSYPDVQAIEALGRYVVIMVFLESPTHHDTD